jgi:hypothetical protein
MTTKEGKMLGETVLFSIACDLLLASKASGAVPPSVLAGAARAEVETALRGRPWRVARVDRIDGVESGDGRRSLQIVLELLPSAGS